MVTLVYFFLFVFALLYSLVIGRASVVSSAPLAVLSLLPSVLISVAAWFLKSTIMDNNTDETSDGKNCHDETDITDTVDGNSSSENRNTNNGGDKMMWNKIILEWKTFVTIATLIRVLEILRQLRLIQRFEWIWCKSAL